MWLRLIILILVIVVSGCNSGGALPSTQKTAWPSPVRDVNSRPEDIAVLSGTTFSWGGVRCQLLGVKDSNDPAIRMQADQFTRKWFNSIGKLMAAYNHSNPLMAADGTPIVWIRGYDSSLSCLNEKLVSAGLVEVDDSSWTDYAFTSPTKGDGDKNEDWRGILRKAKVRKGE